MEEKKFNYVENEKKGRCIYAAPVARALIQKGFAVMDIKPNKENHDKTVFVFEETDDFNAAAEGLLLEYIDKKNKAYERKRLNSMQREAILPDYKKNSAFNDSNY